MNAGICFTFDSSSTLWIDLGGGFKYLAGWGQVGGCKVWLCRVSRPGKVIGGANQRAPISPAMLRDPWYRSAN